MRVKEAAVRLEVSSGTVYSLIASGRLRCYRVGNGRGTIRIAEEHLAEYLHRAERRLGAPPAPAPPLKLRHLRL